MVIFAVYYSFSPIATCHYSPICHFSALQKNGLHIRAVRSSFYRAPLAGCLFFSAAGSVSAAAAIAAATAAAVVAASIAVATAAAAAEQQNQNDDPPAVSEAVRVIIAHKFDLRFRFSGGFFRSSHSILPAEKGAPGQVGFLPGKTGEEGCFFGGCFGKMPLFFTGKHGKIYGEKMRFFSPGFGELTEKTGFAEDF